MTNAAKTRRPGWIRSNQGLCTVFAARLPWTKDRTHSAGRSDVILSGFGLPAKMLGVAPTRSPSQALSLQLRFVRSSANLRITAHAASTSSASVAKAPIETLTIQRPSIVAGVR